MMARFRGIWILSPIINGNSIKKPLSESKRSVGPRLRREREREREREILINGMTNERTNNPNEHRNRN